VQPAFKDAVGQEACVALGARALFAVLRAGLS
jgi:hypothetical protein